MGYIQEDAIAIVCNVDRLRDAAGNQLAQGLLLVRKAEIPRKVVSGSRGQNGQRGTCRPANSSRTVH